MLKAALTMVTLAAFPGLPRFHAELKSSIPARGSSVHSPATVSLTFTEEVSRAGTVIQLMRGDSTAFARLVVQATKDPATVTAKVLKALPPGAYYIKWRTVASDDGHASSGTVPFRVIAGS